MFAAMHKHQISVRAQAPPLTTDIVRIMTYKTKTNLILALTTVTGAVLALVGTITGVPPQSRILGIVNKSMTVAGAILASISVVLGLIPVVCDSRAATMDLEEPSEMPEIVINNMEQPEHPSESESLQYSPKEEENQVYGMAI
ncbi:hypothetical protein K439DRAFT_1618305 [Ramaria rubella]|nr:hypothetical protein K439DRAFT_1618305 [Ramaria rubella]